MSERSYYIPKHLDDPPKMLFWDMDELVVFLILIMPGILTGTLLMLMLFVLLSFVLTAKYIRIKTGKIRGFLMHFSYWYIGVKHKGLPPSEVREISG